MLENKFFIASNYLLYSSVESIYIYIFIYIYTYRAALYVVRYSISREVRRDHETSGHSAEREHVTEHHSLSYACGSEIQ
jgi:hypothetical protein